MKETIKMIEMNDESKRLAEQQKNMMLEKTNKIKKTANRWIWINLSVGIFDLVFAILSGILVFKLLFAGLAIVMFYMIRVHYNHKKRAEALLLSIDKVFPEKTDSLNE